MKKLNKKILAILLIVLTVNLNAQNEDNPWLFSVGLSAVDFYPTGGHSIASGPNFYNSGGLDEFFNVQDHWNVGLPYLSLGRYLDKDVSFVLTGTYNRIKKWGSKELTSELMFLSLDGSFNYSFANLLKSKKIVPSLGIGG